MPRLVACMTCNKIERIPDHPSDVRLVPAKVAWMDGGVEREYEFTHEDGTPILVPEFDPVLEDVTVRHTHGLPDTEVMARIKVFPVDQATYEKMDVVTELKNELAKITGEFFEEADYYRTEATKCYNQHGNPQGSCIDYCDDGKKIGPTSVPKKYQMYLCHLCPIQQAYINVELRRKAGYYDPTKASKLSVARDRRVNRFVKKT